MSLRKLSDKLKRKSASPSPSSRVKRHNHTPDPLATSASQSLAVSETSAQLTRPLGNSALQTDDLAIRDRLPLTAGGNVTTVSSDDRGTPSSSNAHGSVSVPASIPIIQISHSQSEPIAGESPASIQLVDPIFQALGTGTS